MKLGLTTTSRSVPPRVPQAPLAKADTTKRGEPGELGMYVSPEEPPRASLPESETTLVRSESAPQSKRQRRAPASEPKPRVADERADSSTSTKRRSRSTK